MDGKTALLRQPGQIALELIILENAARGVEGGREASHGVVRLGRPSPREESYQVNLVLPRVHLAVEEAGVLVDDDRASQHLPVTTSSRVQLLLLVADDLIRIPVVKVL